VAGTHSGAPTLHEDRFFDPDPTVRRHARALYEETRDLPIVSPHGHVDPAMLSLDEPFPDPARLLVVPDHYVLRMLYSQGVPLEALGVRPRDGGPFETDARRIWHAFAERYALFRGTPTGAWLDHELYLVLGLTHRLEPDTADAVYDEIAEKLRSPEFRPRALYARFGIEVLATTDAATDTLDHHRALAASGWDGRMIPTFRPDALFAIAAPGWRAELDHLAALGGAPILEMDAFLRALEGRRAWFRAHGATATDHGVEVPLTRRLQPEDADALLRRALAGAADAADQARFEAHMLMEMARLSAGDGMVMQLHAGALRDHNREVFRRFGPNLGGDIPVATEYTRNLAELLNAYGNDPAFRLVLFTLDESTYSRELAPLAGHYPALRLGPAWWFHDSLEGMRRMRERTVETAGIRNLAGFNDDTRAFCSIPARHDLSRRVDANWLAGMVARHVVGLEDAREMARALAYDLVRDTYRLDAPPGNGGTAAGRGDPGLAAGPGR
jgi:glucuronate isomerase